VLPLIRQANGQPRVVTAKRLYNDRRTSVDEICETLGIPRLTSYRYLALPDYDATVSEQRLKSRAEFFWKNVSGFSEMGRLLK